MIALAYIAPFLVLLAALLAGRYPGEQLLIALTGSRSPEVRSSRGRRAIRWSGSVKPRRGPLLAFALAARPPPGAGSTTHRSPSI